MRLDFLITVKRVRIGISVSFSHVSVYVVIENRLLSRLTRKSPSVMNFEKFEARFTTTHNWKKNQQLVLRDFRGGDKRELPVLRGSFATLQRFEQKWH